MFMDMADIVRIGCIVDQKKSDGELRDQKLQWNVNNSKLTTRGRNARWTVATAMNLDESFTSWLLGT